MKAKRRKPAKVAEARCGRASGGKEDWIVCVVEVFMELAGYCVFRWCGGMAVA
jgi:hypothetical protein